MSANNNSNNTLLMPHQDGDGIFPKSNARKAIPKVKPKAKPKAQASSSSGKKESKKIVHLSPVESLLFFNIIRFNTNPNTSMLHVHPPHIDLAHGSQTRLSRLRIMWI